MAASAKETLRLLDSFSTPFLAGKAKKQERRGRTGSKQRANNRSPLCSGTAPSPDRRAAAWKCESLGRGGEEAGAARPKTAAELPAGFRPHTSALFQARPHTVEALPQELTAQPSPPAQSRFGPPAIRPPSLPSSSARQPWWIQSGGEKPDDHDMAVDRAIEKEEVNIEFGPLDPVPRLTSSRPVTPSARAILTPRMHTAKPLQIPAPAAGSEPGLAPPGSEPLADEPSTPPSPRHGLRRARTEEAEVEGSHRSLEHHSSRATAQSLGRQLSRANSRENSGRVQEGTYLEREDMRAEMAEELASKYRGGLDNLKEHQAAWRRQHDALVRKKQLGHLVKGASDAVAAGEEGVRSSRPASPAAPAPSGPYAQTWSTTPQSLGTLRLGRDRLRDLAENGSRASDAFIPPSLGLPPERAQRDELSGRESSSSATDAGTSLTAEAPAPVVAAPAIEGEPSLAEISRNETRRTSEKRVLIEDSADNRRPEPSAATAQVTPRRSSTCEALGQAAAADSGGAGQHPEHHDGQHQQRSHWAVARSTLRGQPRGSFLASIGAHNVAGHGQGAGPRLSEAGGGAPAHPHPGAAAASGSHAPDRASRADAWSSAAGVFSPRADRAPQSNFNCAVTMARKHKLPLEEVRMRRQEFQSHALNEDKEMAHAEFEDLVRRYCGIEPGGDIPAHLLRQHAKAQAGVGVTFEDFLLWSVATAWLPERLVSDPEERRLRQVARDNGLCITDVERIKGTFDKFDHDGSGFIEEKEFRNLVLTLMNVKNNSDVSAKRLHRYWCEVDNDRSGSISFEEFLQWYYNLFEGK